ncbi:MAG TPA: serine/threonine-protein kinase, partial [Myxococcales bacterium]|nr:serine/threonine-protein kinase [Myxococcales bacterium]
MTQVDEDQEDGIAFGHYRLLRRLGVGGMAEVFLARRAGDRLGRLVAVKRILPEHAASPEVLETLLDEARMATHLDHPQIVSVNDVGEVDGMVFLAMEYVHGVSLHRALELWSRSGRGQFPWPIACRIAICVCEALEYAHALKDPSGHRLDVVHRDVNPANILLGFNGVVKLTDFGIALSTVKEAVTRPGVVMAKLEYGAPEQYRGEPLDPRTDVYGVGMTLYQVLSGQLPFSGLSQPQAIRAILERDPPPLSSLRRDLPQALGFLVDRALAKVPSARFQGANEVRTRLESLLMQIRLKVGMLELAGFVAELTGTPLATSPVSATERGG